MQVIVNGEHRTLTNVKHLADALIEWGYHDEMPIAVAVNNQVVPRQDRKDYLLAAGNVIEILMPMQGG